MPFFILSADTAGSIFLVAVVCGMLGVAVFDIVRIVQDIARWFRLRSYPAPNPADRILE